MILCFESSSTHSGTVKKLKLKLLADRSSFDIDKEEWMLFQREKSLPKAICLGRLCEDKDHLVLIFDCGHDQKVIITFELLVHSYRRTLESSFLKSLNYIYDKYDSPICLS